jgi:hypothetical protein
MPPAPASASSARRRKRPSRIARSLRLGLPLPALGPRHRRPLPLAVPIDGATTSGRPAPVVATVSNHLARAVRSVRQLERRGEIPHRPVGALAIGLVHHQHVGDLQQPALMPAPRRPGRAP